MPLEIDVRVVVSPRETARRLRDYGKSLDAALDPLIKRRIHAIRDEAKTYEAPRTASYQRTGNMSRQTIAGRIERGDRGKGWLVEMRAPYSRYVRGTFANGGQAWMHKGRWNTLRSIVERRMEGFFSEVDKTLADLKKRFGF